MGIVPNLVTGVWVGGEDRSVHFDEIGFGQGATMALPIWALFMKGAYENQDFSNLTGGISIPEVVSIPLECEEYEFDNNPTSPTNPKADLDQLGF